MIIMNKLVMHILKKNCSIMQEKHYMFLNAFVAVLVWNMITEKQISKTSPPQPQTEYVFNYPKYSKIERYGKKNGKYGGGFYAFNDPEDAALVDWNKLMSEHGNSGVYNNNTIIKHVALEVFQVIRCFSWGTFYQLPQWIVCQ